MRDINNLKEDIVIIDGNFDLFKKSLDEKKVVLAAVEMGQEISGSLKKNWSDFLQTHVHLKSTTNKGICFCKKPATHLVYFWR